MVCGMPLDDEGTIALPAERESGDKQARDSTVEDLARSFYLLRRTSIRVHPEIAMNRAYVYRNSPISMIDLSNNTDTKP